MARAGTLPVLVGAVDATSPGRVHVQILDRQQASPFGAPVLALRVVRADGGRSAARVRIAVDYGGFERAYGGDFATRLHLVKFAPCVGSPRCPSTPVPTTRDGTGKRLIGDASVAPDPESASYDSLGEPVPVDEPTAFGEQSMTTMAVDSGTSGEVSDYSATPFQASQKWQVGVGSGNFGYSYDIPLPPPVAGPVPRIALDYSSQSVDGRTASENSQPSQVGEGWSFEPGYIERKFVSCSDDGWSKGDFCWNATPAHFLHLNGVSAELVRPTTGGNEWRLRDDPAWRVQHFSMPTTQPNGDVSRTYWVVTTPDGTRYQFGTGSEPTTGTATNSAWTVPVFGNNSGEACYNAVASLAYCDAAWRFNLDYVKDVNGNAVTLFWAKETNRYQRFGAGATGSASHQYVRGGYLTRVEYSQRAGSEGATAPSVVVPATANRCTVSGCKGLDDSTVDLDQYPDVPGDLVCWSATSCSKSSPSFFSGKKIVQFETWVWNGSNYRSVTQINLTHTFPSTGEADVSPALWLSTITRVGTLTTPERPDPVSLPHVAMYGEKLPNRVDTGPGVPATYKYRLVAIRNEIGGEVEVTYDQPNPCSPIPTNSWDTNTKDCFPQAFTPTGGTPGIGAFNKYLVTKMRVLDGTGVSGSGYAITTNYTYFGTPAWHYDDALGGGSSQMWSDYRGYQRVQTQVPGPNGLLSTTQHLLFRGMHGDKLVGGGTKIVPTPDDTEGASFTDSNWLAGRTIEVSRYSTGGTHLASELYRYWAHNTVAGPTAFQPHNAYYVRQSTSITKYADTSTTTNDWVRRRVDTTFDDDYAYPTQTFDWGNSSGPLGDETCERYATTPNTTAWLLSVRYQTLTYDGTCSNTNAPMTARHDVYYDGQAFSAVPVKGMPTTVGNSVNATTRALTRTAYDALGRVTEMTGPNQYFASAPKKTVTSYSPATGYPYNGITVTNPMGHVSKSISSSAWGGVVSATDPNNKTTHVDRDPLGRTVAVRRPLDGGTANPSVKYTYGVYYNQPSWVKRGVLQSNNGTARYVDDYTWVDGLGRTVQTQTRSPYRVNPNDPLTTGRIVTSTRYDIQGNVDAQIRPQWDNDGNGSGYLNIVPSSVEVETRFEYDSLGRQVDAQHWSDNALQWRTRTTHYGTHVKIDHPVRGDVRRYNDVFGRLTKVTESLSSGTADTTYTYRARGELDTITDDLGNVWDYDYDWLGRRTRSKDPDQGTWQTSYDLEGHVATVTDAKHDTIAYAYDHDGRRTGTFGTSTSGTQLASWTYDSVPNGIGRLASATRIDGGSSYVTAVTAYDDRGRALGKSTTIPTAEGPLAGTYTYGFGYDLADNPTTVAFPAAGDLPAETVTTSYDELTGHPKTMIGASSYVSDTEYNGEALPLKRTIGPTGVVRSFAYGDAARRLTLVTTTSGATTVEKTGYHYDADGNVTAIVDETSPTTIQTECFRYDARNQLTRAFTNAGGASTCGTPAPAGADPYDLAYVIDTIGNIKTVTSGTTTTTHTYPPSGQTSIRPHAVSSVGATTYVYNDNGAMEARGADVLAWDELHQLKSVTGSTSATFTYDADGTRLVRRVGASPARTVYLDGMELTATGTGPVTATRYFGSVATRTAAGVTTLLRNNQNSASMSIDPSGVVVRRKYLPYGGQRGSTDLATERGFVDRIEDPTGLVAVGARYYDPSSSKFVSADPVVTPSAPQTLNGYAYAHLNPTSLVDPSGLEPYPNSDGSWGGWGCATGACGNQPSAEDTKLGLQAAQSNPVAWVVGNVVRRETEHRRRDPAAYWRNVASDCNTVLPGNGGIGGACERRWVASRIAAELAPPSPPGHWRACFSGNSQSACAQVLQDIANTALDMRSHHLSLLKRILRSGVPMPGGGSLQLVGTGFAESELAAATHLANRGHAVVLRRASGAHNVKTSDLVVDGVLWDVYTPNTASLRSIANMIAGKGAQVQGGGVIVDLVNSPLNASDINVATLLRRVQNSTSRVSDIIIFDSGAP